MAAAAISTFGAGRVDPIRDPDLARLESFNIPNSTVIAKGTVVGEITASPGVVKAYATGNVDGSQNPIGIMQYDVASDASGNITLGGAAGASEWGQTSKGCPVYTRGKFATADLVGLDAGGAAKLGRLVRGSVTDGEIAVNGG